MATSRTNKAMPAPDSSGGNKLFIGAIAALVVVGVLVVAILASGRESSFSPEQVAAVTLGGDSLPPLPDGLSVSDPTTDPLAGQEAPTLVGTDFDGNEVTIEPDGKAKAIYFLAHWCPHCQDEVPVLQDLLAADKLPADVDIYAVSTAVDLGRGNYPPETWLEDEGLDAMIVRDSEGSEAFSYFGGSGFPYAVYLDTNHQIVARTSGQVGADIIESLWVTSAEVQ